MARGVISTVLGGLAGGFEGLAARQQRQRAEAERERERQDILAQQRFANEIAVIGAGGQIGGAPRIRQDVAAPAAPPRSSALDSALFAGEQVDRGEGLVDRPDFSQFARPRTEFVVDPDYQTISMGDQEYSFLAPEARERRAEVERVRAEQAAAALRREAQDFEVFKMELANEFAENRDLQKYLNDRSLAGLNHGFRLAQIEARAGGETGLGGLTAGDISRFVLNNMVKEGIPDIGPDGQVRRDPMTDEPLRRPPTPQEVQLMRQTISAGFRDFGDDPAIPEDDTPLAPGLVGQSFRDIGRVPEAILGGQSQRPRTQSSAPVSSYVPTTGRTRTPEDLRWWPIPQGARSAAAGFFMPPTQGRPSPWDR